MRSPAEFAKGHWPGAANLPLFSNEERAEVGTLYKQSSPDDALLRGLELVGPKMRWLIEQARELAPQGELTLHCWRGGQRSQSVGWLLEKGGLKVQLLAGGYKALRNYGRQQLLAFDTPLLILGGPTGSGKTKVLQALAQQGGHIVDLEGLADHKGSAFGALGESPQPTVEQFENDIFENFLSYADLSSPLWLENESRAIGQLYLPEEIWRKMLAAPLVNLEMPLDWRVQNLVEDYAHFSRDDLKLAFAKISKRLGGQYVKAAHEAIDAGSFADAALIALRYYDKAYQRGLEKTKQEVVYTLRPQTGNIDEIAKLLLDWQEAQV